MRRLTLSVSSAVTAFLAAPAVLVTPTPAYSQALEEITVTARKTTESLQDVPLAITALGAEEIDRLGLKDLNSITQQDTSVQFDEGFTPSDTRITIRGLSPTRGRPNAATLVDGIDVSSEAVSNAGGSLLINPRLVDVERIEIVKGPQSALYGRSAFAGAIQYVTKDPSDVLEGSVRVDVTSEDQQELTGNVSIPITDTLGVLINGLAYDSRGIYKNVATDDYVGGASGYGASLTFKWEPTDTVGVKWRTEYTDEEFAPVAQILLDDFSKLYDLGDSSNLGDLLARDDPRYGGVNLAPGSAKCSPDVNSVTPDLNDPTTLPGPLNSSGCEDFWVWDGNTSNANPAQFETRPNGTKKLEDYFSANEFSSAPLTQTQGGVGVIYAGNVDLNAYDSTQVSSVGQYNKQLGTVFTGTIPGADALGGKARLAPNYQFGRGATDPANADDYDGTTKEVFRTSLVVDWAINDALTFTSLTGYTDADVGVSQDIGKVYADNCSPGGDAAAIAANLAGFANPMAGWENAVGGGPGYQGSAANYYEYLTQDLGITDPNMLAGYAPCSDFVTDVNGDGTPGDGISDLSNFFIENSENNTKQFSQELRLAWQVTESLNFTQGLQFWSEEVKVFDLNSTMIAGGNQAYLQGAPGTPGGAFNDSSYGGFGASGINFTETNPLQNQASRSSLIGAYWTKFGYQGRIEQPSNTERTTDHYSWYGALDYDLTDKLSMRLEGRYTKEDNTVTGPVMTPCINGLPYYNNLIDADDQDPNNNDGTEFEGRETNCSNGSNSPSGQPSALETANGGQATGPSAIIICGQTGDCQRTAAAFQDPSVGPAGNQVGWTPYNVTAPNSFWYNGFKPTLSNPVTLERQDNYWAPKFTTEYFFTDDVMTYFSWSRGIKPGGFSLLTSGAFGLDANLDGNFDEIEFEPETLDVWEIGTKTTLADGRIRFNGSMFFQDFKDKQVTVQKVTGGTTGTEVVNISGSEVRGLEMDLTFQITDNFRAQVGYTFLDSEYTDYDIITQSNGDILRLALSPAQQDCSEKAELPGSTATAKQFGCALSFNGNELERAPRNAWLVNANYSRPLMDTNMEWYIEGNYRYQDSRYLEAFNIVQFPSYSLTDVRFGLVEDKWDVQLYVNNVFDNDTVISGGANPGIATGNFGFGIAALFPPSVNAGPKLPSDTYANLPNPRIAGIRASYRFGQ